MSRSRTIRSSWDRHDVYEPCCDKTFIYAIHPQGQCIRRCEKKKDRQYKALTNIANF